MMYILKDRLLPRYDGTSSVLSLDFYNRSLFEEPLLRQNCQLTGHYDYVWTSNRRDILITDLWLAG